MGKNSPINMEATNNSDGGQFGGGITRRLLKWLGADITLTGSGTNVFTFPSATDTLVGRASTDTLTNKTLTGPVFTGGSATAGSKPTLSTGTVLTTPAVGAVELDAGGIHYLTGVASSRQVVGTEQWIRLTSAYTLTSQTTAQKMFNSPTNGTLTVPASTAYEFECSFSLTALSSSSGSFGFAFGGTATLTSQAWTAIAVKGTTSVATAIATAQSFNVAANTTIAAANINTFGVAYIRGFVTTNAAGTLIPQISLTVAAAAIVGTGAFFRIWPVGASATNSIGNWS